MQEGMTILRYIESVTPQEWIATLKSKHPDIQDDKTWSNKILEKWMEWPPDIIVLTSFILKKTGAYIGAILPIEEWPKDPDWQDELNREKDNWYQWILNFDLNEENLKPQIPNIMKENIELIIANDKVTLSHLRNLFTVESRKLSHKAQSEQNPWEVCKALLELHAFADEICRNFGTPSPANWTDEGKKKNNSETTEVNLLEEHLREEHLPEETLPDTDKTFIDYKRAIQCIANILLTNTGTLSRISPDIAKVLPKLRTPNTGMTLRNLSHHVTMHQTEVEVVWRTMPWVNIDEDTINILIVPWPMDFKANWFKPSLHSSKRGSREQTRFFEYTGPPCKENFKPDNLLRMIENAEELVNRVHIVIFPELALTEDNQKEVLEALAKHKDRDKLPMVVTGMRSGTKDDETKEKEEHLSANSIVLSTFFAGRWYELKQSKHHRWKIGDSQITQYKLSGVLAGNRNWWEAIPITQRKLSVLAPNKWFALCPLICEDLARQEPVSELIRGIGPTMVTAILLDGPQLEKRWSGRYASVLADDPGSSVLTVSSLGLARRSVSRNGEENTSVVALWKDNVKGSYPIEIENISGVGGVVLTVTAQWIEESTADGRLDNNSAAVLVHQTATLVTSEYQKSDSSKSETTSDNNHKYKLSDDNDFLEITLFSYFVDAVLEADKSIVKELKRWMIGTGGEAKGKTQEQGIKRLESKEFHLWDKIESLQGILNPDLAEEHKRNEAQKRENLKPFLDWFCELIQEIPSSDRSEPLKNLQLIINWAEHVLEVVNSDDFLDMIFNDQDPFIRLRQQNKECPIPRIEEVFQSVDKPTQVRIFIYGCLAMLWAVHARLNIIRRNGLLKPAGMKLLSRVEELLKQRHDDKWYKAIDRSSKGTKAN